MSQELSDALAELAAVAAEMDQESQARLAALLADVLELRDLAGPQADALTAQTIAGLTWLTARLGDADAQG